MPAKIGTAMSLSFGSSEEIRFSMEKLPYVACFASDIEKDEKRRSIIYLVAVQDVEK